MRHFTKILPLLMMMGSTLLLLVSCHNGDDDEPVLPPEIEQPLVLKFKADTVSEFKLLMGSMPPQDLPIDDSYKELIGKGLHLILPQSISFKKDSVVFTKPYSIVENYACKRKKDNILLFDSKGNTWKTCGQWADDKTFLLNIGVCIVFGENGQRSLAGYVTDYSLTSFDSSMKAPSDLGVWVRVEAKFEK